MREIIAIVRYVLCDENTDTLEDINDDVGRLYMQLSDCECKKDVLYLREVKKSIRTNFDTKANKKFIETRGKLAKAGHEKE